MSLWQGFYLVMMVGFRNTVRVGRVGGNIYELTGTVHMNLTSRTVDVVRKFIRATLRPIATNASGRRKVARLIRFIENEVRFDGPNDMHQNGEVAVQRDVLRACGGPSTVLDVGANVGDWIFAFARTADATRRTDYVIHAFEPCQGTRSHLEARIKASRLAARVIVHGSALSSNSGTAELQVVGDGVGINSLHRPYGHVVRNIELVTLETLDAFAASRGISHVTFIKIDAEGHDCEVLKGAAGLLGRAAVDVIQFEYNSRWIGSRTYLFDVFRLLPDTYCLGKVTPFGIEWYPAWDPELETFREGNYLICKWSCRSWFREIRWWHLDS